MGKQGYVAAVEDFLPSSNLGEEKQQPNRFELGKIHLESW
jgi:hypothetical protein